MKPKAASFRATPKKKVIRKAVKSPSNEYDLDYYKWIQHQISFLKKGKLEKIDLANLIEEIESLGKGEKRELLSHTSRLLMNLLIQPEGQKNSSLLLAKRAVQRLLKESPSLKNELPNIFPEAYEIARLEASVESNLPLKSFPKNCPWELKEVLPFLSLSQK